MDSGHDIEGSHDRVWLKSSSCVYNGHSLLAIKTKKDHDSQHSAHYEWVKETPLLQIAKPLNKLQKTCLYIPNHIATNTPNRIAHNSKKWLN